MWQQDIAFDLKLAAPAERADIIARYQEMTGYSREHLYRVARKNRFDSGRTQRSDKGVSRNGITPEQVQYVAGLLYVTGRENKGPIMPIEEALEIAYDNEVIERGQISVGAMSRMLREHQLSKERMKDPTPYTEMRSMHPNYCHLADVSVCIQYYLKNGKLGIMDERDFYKNKPDSFAKIKQKLLRYVLADHFSGLFVWKYYVAEGESRENLWDFLKWAWAPKTDNRLPFQGVPPFMLMDANSAQKSHALQNFFKGLGVVIPKGMPYNPRRQGGVETVHNIIENRFETKLRICPAYSVEELNAWALDYAIMFHATKTHSRHKMTRLSSWMLIKPEQLRLLPPDEILNMIYAEPEKECTVRNYRFPFRGEEYNVKHLPGMHHNELAAHQGAFSEGAAIIGQTYKAQPATETQKGIEEINRMAYGEREHKKGDIPFEGTLVFGHQAAKVGNLATLPKRGTAIEVARPSGPVTMPFMELLKRLRAANVKITPELNRQLRTEFGETIDAVELERVVNAIVTGNDWHEQTPQRQIL
jgi:hypothetical protein